MKQLSSNQLSDATKKRPKIHLFPQEISRKITACEELLNNKRSTLSAREVAELLAVPNSTMQSWRLRKNSDEPLNELAIFLSSPVGADFLHRNIHAVMKLLKCGPSGIRGMQEYLQNSGLDLFVASSEGALQNFWARCEDAILEFGEREEKRLAQGMSHRKITAGLDEMFRGRKPCLVAIDVVSNYVLLEKFTENRTAQTWQNELEERLKGMPVTINQVVSDLCGAIRACTATLGATHIPELFHAQHEISKATSAPLASQERSAEIICKDAEEKLQTIKGKPKRLEKAAQAQQQFEIKEAQKACEPGKIELEKRTKRRTAVKGAIREMGKIHHRIDLQTGQIQTAAAMEARFAEQFTIIQKCSEEAMLIHSSFERIEKAKNAFKAIVLYLKYFFTMYEAYVTGMKLTLEQKNIFNEIFFPLCYLKMIWKRLPRIDKEKYIDLLNNLEEKARAGPWPDALKQNWLQSGKELAEMFQRSSSCVEGRNGMLSLNYHRFHRLSKRSLKVLTIVHNFDTQRTDGTTAAERFFGGKHEKLFDALVTNVRIPGRPQRQCHQRKHLPAA